MKQLPLKDKLTSSYLISCFKQLPTYGEASQTAITALINTALINFH